MPTPIMIGSPRIKRERGGVNTYEAEFLFTGTEAENRSAMPKLGSLASWMPASATFPPVSPANEVINCECEWLGGLGSTAQWLWKVSAQTGTDSKGGDSTQRTPENLKKKVESSYSTKEVHLDPIWWGLVKADKEMTGAEPRTTLEWTRKSDSKKFKLDTKTYYPRAGGTAYTCHVNDFIFKNANPTIKLDQTEYNETTGLWDASGTQPTPSYVDPATYPQGQAGKFFTPYLGTTNARLSPYGVCSGQEATDPYVVTQGPDSDTLGFAGQKCKVLLYTVTFYVKNPTESPGALSAADMKAFWAGIQPSSNPYGSTTQAGLLRPVFYDEPGFWKATENRVDEMRDTDGKTWAKITRTMEGSPRIGTTPWRWNAARSFHGYWSW